MTLPIKLTIIQQSLTEGTKSNQSQSNARATKKEAERDPIS